MIDTPVMNNLSIGQLADIVGGQLRIGSMPPLGGHLEPVGGVVTDSRRVKPGTVFWGLVGPNFDAGDFAEEAFSHGALGVVTRRRVEPWAGKFSIQIQDTGHALRRLAQSVRSRFAGRIIGVAGRAGKTTARQMIDIVLSSRLRGSSGCVGGGISAGVPLSLLHLAEDSDYGLIELADGLAGDADSPAHLSCPHIGVITCAGDTPYDRFDDVPANGPPEVDLLSALPDDGWAVLNGDDSRLTRAAQRCGARVVRVGRGSSADVVATNVRSQEGRITFDIDGTPFCVPVWGRHHLTSALLAYAVGQIMDIPPAEISDRLSRFQPLPGRCEVTEFGGMTVINDTYNTSPAAARAALALLRDFDTTGRRIVVCGEMAESGKAAGQLHRQLGDDVVTLCGADLLVACGGCARQMVIGARDAGMPLGRAIACRHPEETLPVLQSGLAPGDVVLIKGGPMEAMQGVVEALLGKSILAAA